MNNKLRINVHLLYSIQVIEEFLEETVELLIPIWYGEYTKIRDVQKSMHVLYEEILKRLIVSKNDEVVDCFNNILQYFEGLIMSLKLQNPDDIYTQPYPELDVDLMKTNPNFALEQYYYDQLSLGC